MHRIYEIHINFNAAKKFQFFSKKRENSTYIRHGDGDFYDADNAISNGSSSFVLCSFRFDFDFDFDSKASPGSHTVTNRLRTVFNPATKCNEKKTIGSFGWCSAHLFPCFFFVVRCLFHCSILIFSSVCRR